MDENSKEKTLEKLTKAENVLVVTSKSAGFDGLAAALSLYLSCRKLGKSVSIVAPPPTVEDARKLYAVDKIGKLIDRKQLIIVVDNAVKTVEKVSYFLENDRLKILVHSLPGTSGISKEQISLEQDTNLSDFVFLVGFSSLEELNKIYLREQLVDANVWLVAINQENVSLKFAHANLFNPSASGLSEITAHLLRDLALPLDEDISYNLYAGIASSTDNFSPAKTQPETFQIASWLIKFGAGRASLAKVSFPKATTDFKDQLTSLDLQPKGAVAGTDIPKFPLNSTPITEVETEKTPEEDWFKPPKIYKGSKSFDKEY